MGNNVACIFFSVTLVMIINLVVPASIIVFSYYYDYCYGVLRFRVQKLTA